MSSEPLKAVCSWCKQVMREGAEPVTHGICPACDAKLRAENGLPARAPKSSGLPPGCQGFEIDEAVAAQVEAVTTADAQACLKEGVHELAELNNALLRRLKAAEQAEAIARLQRDGWRRAAQLVGIN